MTQLLIKRKAYHRKGYTRKDGTKVKASDIPATTFRIGDTGALGRTPKSKRWFPIRKTHTGWSKGLSQRARIARVVKAHKGDLLASARSLTALSNVTTDLVTKTLARRDAQVLYDRYAR